MALFNRDYGRDYRYRNTGYRGAPTGGYDRDMGDRMRSGWNNLTGRDRDRSYGSGASNQGMGGYDRDFRNRGTPGARMGGGLGGYDRDFDRDRGAMGKSRSQVDQGDPFNDRSRGTPFRTMRGEYEGGQDRDFGNRNRNYDRDFNDAGYGAGGVGYDPYRSSNDESGRSRAWMERQNGGNFRNDRGYDRGMF